MRLVVYIHFILVVFHWMVSFRAIALEPIRIQIVSDPKALEPSQMSDLIGFSILTNTVETLMKSDEKGQLQKALAKNYQVSKDGLTYTFEIRKDAKWSDGKIVTPED